MKSIALLALSLSFVAGSATFGAAQETATAIVDANAPMNGAIRSPNDMGSGTLAAGQNSFTMKQAQARIRRAGYSDVSVLAKDVNGLWSGEASRNGQRVPVFVDFKGDVSSQ